ncbi:MAG: class I SAM-dependent methyltransferase [Culturomica sp.]|jgi:predicted O-methyltransferase YrrM|nr:class I SAM-dependent methyltransferase [Culturomica sp.]
MEERTELEQYIAKHSEAEPPLLAELRRATHLRVMRPRMLSGNLQAQFLKMLCRLMGAGRVLEIGTYTGYTAISLASALPEDGKVVTIDCNDEIEEIARSFFVKSGLGSKIDFRIGKACRIIPELEGMFDLVFLDADKREYADYYEQVFDKVRPGGVIVADDVLWDGKVTDERHTDPQTEGILRFNERVAADGRVEKLMLPIRHGLTLIRKKDF